MKARNHLLRAFDRLGVEIHENTTIDRIEEEGVVTADGISFPSDATVWAAGFVAHPIATDSGLQVEEDGRITVDRMMRSVSHPNVYAAGDSVFTLDDNGRPLPMSCASAGFTGNQATAAIVGDLTGHEVSESTLAYLGNCISLGQNDAVFQMVDREATSKTWSLRGRPGTLYKKFVLNAVAWRIVHPTYGMPARKRHATTTEGGSVERVSA
ncbi:NAD(P)/FAD-dependent oxidoreductase [Rhodococcus sp. NPDC058521]|uniref:NAD(P)/FAD-dependent oxidoreductase n=1 Tax=Rhodococcus sp. NPDC058521 TaxID=3346536 RepID=UPI00364BBA07